MNSISDTFSVIFVLVKKFANVAFFEINFPKIFCLPSPTCCLHSQRFQPSETKKWEVLQVPVILIPKWVSGAFCLKIGDVLAQQDRFSTI